MVILGKTGRNFAAGMSGGIAYVMDNMEEFRIKCNLGTIGLERIADAEEEAEVKDLVTRHLEYTGSEVARRVLANWSEFVANCVKVMPTDYKRVMQLMKENKELVFADE